MVTRGWKITVAATMSLTLVNFGLLLQQQFNAAKTQSSQNDMRLQILEVEKNLQELKKDLETPKSRLLSQNQSDVSARN